MKQITPTQLKHHLDSIEEHPLLLDVREPWEYELCYIEGSQLIPLAELHHRFTELPTQREIIAICHHGIRSMQAATMLVNNEFDKVTNLSGGIHQWALQVEPTMPRY